MYLYTSRPLSWSDELYLAGSADADEGYPDLRNYTSPGNQYINASYISEVGPDRRVYRRFAHAANPTIWSDTLRITDGNAGTGSEVRPRLCYTPGGPFSGAGCVFVGSGLNGLWWNAPYPSSVGQTPDREAQALDCSPAVVRGSLILPAVNGQRTAVGALIDISGRKVLGLKPGANDVSRLAPGVYFVQEKPQAASFKPKAVRKVVIQH
jgi:hypothetical protein